MNISKLNIAFMKKTVFIAMCLFGLAAAAHAQTVNGMVAGNIYTLEQMKAAFGNNPTFQSTSVSNDGTNYSLDYGDDHFSFDTEYGWTHFTIKTSTYPVVIGNVTLRVGDDISVLSTIPNSQLVLKEPGLYDLLLPPMDCCAIWIGFDSSNVITEIIFNQWM
jgi:hypothetical protein